MAWTHTGFTGDIFRYTDPNISPPVSVSTLTITISNTNTILNWPPVIQDIFGNILQNVQYSIYSADEPYFTADSTSLYAVTPDTFYADTVVISAGERFYQVKAVSN